MDQRGDRSRTRHRVGEPYVEGDLGRLAGGADEQQQADRRHDSGRAQREFRREPVHVRERERRRTRRGETPEQQEQAGQERGVADPVRDEGLAAGVGVRGIGVPEADEEVGTEADALPADEEHRQGVGEHQHEHRRGEEVQVGEEARQIRVVVHVPERVEMDQEPHAGDHEEHDTGQGVETKGQVHPQRRDVDPGRHQVDQRMPLLELPETGDGEEHEQEGDQHGARADDLRERAPVGARRKHADRRAEQRQQRDQAEQRGFELGHGDRPGLSSSTAAGFSPEGRRSRPRRASAAARNSPG